LAVAANRDGEPQLFKIPVGGGTPILLVKEYSIDPIWSPSGQWNPEDSSECRCMTGNY
jgi:hypothetical protein